MLPRAEHVWITDIQVWGNVGAPGLLLGWQRGDDGAWHGWVISVLLGPTVKGGGGPFVRQGWVRAESIKPAQPPGRGP